MAEGTAHEGKIRRVKRILYPLVKIIAYAGSSAEGYPKEIKIFFFLFLIDKSEFDEERDCMGKAILAMIVTVIVGYISGAIFANWVNAPEWGVILAVAVMGAFIIYFNDKKQ